MAGRKSKRQMAYADEVNALFADFASDQLGYSDKIARLLVELNDDVTALIMGITEADWRTLKLAQTKEALQALLDDFRGDFEGVMLEALTNAADKGTDGVINPILATLDFSTFAGTPNIFTPAFTDDYIRASWNLTTTLINKITKEQGEAIWDAIVLGMATDRPKQEVLAEIVTLLGGDKLSFKTVGHRANAIFRTESARIHSYATQLQMLDAQQFIPNAQKVWHHGVYGLGQSPRQGHLALDPLYGGTPIPFREYFVNPYTEQPILFPHAPDAVAGEVVNCNCGHSLYMPDDSYLRDQTLVLV